MNITTDLIKLAAPECQHPDLAAAACQAAFDHYGIRSRLAVAGVLAQFGHESGLNPIDERGDQYTAHNILTLWPSHFTPAQAHQLAGNGRAVLNRAYGGRMGNTQPDDGYNFRGRGYIQVTGRSEYELLSRATGLDLVGHPELLNQHGPSALAGCAFFTTHNLLDELEAGNVDRVSYVINGGWNGLADRRARFQRLTAYIPKTPGVPTVFLRGLDNANVRWDGQDTVYGGVNVTAALVSSLALAYPAGSKTIIGGKVGLTVYPDGAMQLDRIGGSDA